MAVFNSTFYQFSSSMEGKFEHLKIMHQLRLSPEMYDMVYDLIKNETVVEELSELFGQSITKLAMVDDFRELINGLAPKICIGFSLIPVMGWKYVVIPFKAYACSRGEVYISLSSSLDSPASHHLMLKSFSFR